MAGYRGLTIRITVDQTSGEPTSILWYIDGRLAESCEVNCDSEVGKKIALAVVDRRVAKDAEWAGAEYRDQRARLLRRRPD